MTILNRPQIILASGSPRRQQLLRDLGLPFEIITANIDETPLPNEAPVVLVKRLAESKAQAVVDKQDQRDEALLILAADTIVALDEAPLGKPTDADDAKRMLTQLRDRDHQVHSGLSIIRLEPESTATQQTKINSSTIYMRNYSDAEIAEYVASGDPLDKAGAYAIQHPVFAPVKKLDGCVSGVMGLSLVDLVTLLADFGVTVTVEGTESICEGYAPFACCKRCEDSGLLTAQG